LSNKNLNFTNFSQAELKDLVDESKKGDNKSFNTLSLYVRNIAGSYFRSKYNAGKIKNEDDVEDLTNSVYLTFAEKFQEIEKLENWLRRVLFLTFVNWYKKNRTNAPSEFDESFYLENSSSSPAQQHDLNKIIELLNNLKDEKKEVVKHKFFKGLKFREIAEIMNKNEAAVKKIFYRTIEEIKQKLNED
jgi:RNA polymerase sigma-70 factor (ECF subfamily)